MTSVVDGLSRPGACGCEGGENMGYIYKHKKFEPEKLGSWSWFKGVIMWMIRKGQSRAQMLVQLPDGPEWRLEDHPD